MEGRQTRGHLFRECVAWKKEIRELWKRVGEVSDKGRRSGLLKIMRRPGNTPIKSLLPEERFIGPVLDLLKSTGVGMIKEGVVLSSGMP